MMSSDRMLSACAAVCAAAVCLYALVRGLLGF